MDTLTRTQGNIQTGGVSAPQRSTNAQPAPKMGEFVQSRANQTLGAQTQAGNVQPRQETADAGPSRDANVAPAPTDKQEIGRQQSQFETKMKDAGFKASHPPTQAELKDYFASFNSKDKRGKALEEYENYTTAYHVHTAEVKGKETQDVKYSPEQTYVYKGQQYDNKAEALKAAKADPGGVLGTISTADASKWDDIAKKPDHNGRKVQDCEGFAYMSQELLGAAGYQVTQTSNKGNEGAHSMTAVKDSDSGKNFATSNNRTFAGATQDEALRKGWQSVGTGDGGTYYTGDTQAHAQTARVVAEKGW